MTYPSIWQVATNFRKTATNFHYEFNIRHLSNVFQGLLVAQPDQFKTAEKFVLLWMHESERVYGDRLVRVLKSLFKMHWIRFQSLIVPPQLHRVHHFFVILRAALDAGFFTVRLTCFIVIPNTLLSCVSREGFDRGSGQVQCIGSAASEEVIPVVQHVQVLCCRERRSSGILPLRGKYPRSNLRPGVGRYRKLLLRDGNHRKSERQQLGRCSLYVAEYI